MVFGTNDRFTTVLARILRRQPFFFLIPGDGSVQLQPLWVEDLTTCLTWALEDQDTLDRTIDIGGPEYLTFQQIIDALMEALGPVETVRFLTLPRQKRLDSVARHRRWQSSLDKDAFFRQVFDS